MYKGTKSSSLQFLLGRVCGAQTHAAWKEKLVYFIVISAFNSLQMIKQIMRSSYPHAMLLIHTILLNKVCLSLTDGTFRDRALHNANLSEELQTYLEETHSLFSRNF